MYCTYLGVYTTTEEPHHFAMAVMGREQQAQSVAPPISFGLLAANNVSREIGEFDHVFVELALNDNSDVEEDLRPARPSKYPAKTHARRVAKLLPSDSGLIYLVGATSELFEDSDMGPKLRQRRYFLYLSGVVDIPDCELLYSISDDHLTLYIPPLDSEKVLWSGMPLSPQQCRRKYDVDTVYTTSSVSDHIAAYHKQNRTAPIYFIHQQTSSIPLNIPKSLLDGTALQPAVDDCRVYKDPYEVSLIRRANEISAAGHKLLMAAVKRARNEAELEAVFTAACIRRQAKVQAYDPIIGAGRNAAFLHYMKNNEPTKGRQLLLADCGAEWEGYASDVTRTYPISGCWTAEAAAIYNIVEEMQRECIKRSVKGVDWRDTQLLAHRVALKGLLRLGIMKGDEEEIFAAGTTKAFFPHGIG